MYTHTMPSCTPERNTNTDHRAPKWEHDTKHGWTQHACSHTLYTHSCYTCTHCTPHITLECQELLASMWWHVGEKHIDCFMH